MWNFVATIIMISCSFLAKAQDSILIAEGRKFNDGIYLTYEDFKYDRPTYPLIGVKVLKIDSNQFHLASIYKIQIKNTKGKYKTLSIKNVWGLCYKGKPYVNYRGSALEAGSNTGEKFFMQNIFGKEVITFFRIVTIGRYCVFTIEGNKPGYNTNTMTNKPYQEKYQFVARKILDLSNGKIQDLNFNTAMKAIDSDPYVKALFDENPISEALDKNIYLYNARNPYWTNYNADKNIDTIKKKNKKHSERK